MIAEPYHTDLETLSFTLYLSLQDVASYVIARTLGVIDATKASTSGVPAHAQSTDTDGVPSIHVSLSSPAAGELVTTETETETEAEHETGPEAAGAGAGTRAGAAPSASSDSLSFFRDTLVEEGNPRLAGIDAFSPAPSQPSSPTLSRKDLAVHGHHQLGSGFGLGLAPLETREEDEEDEEASSVGSSRFTMIDGESGSDESAEGVLVRRRARRVDEDAS